MEEDTAFQFIQRENFKKSFGSNIEGRQNGNEGDIENKNEKRKKREVNGK